jgi:hypothetical protein
METQKTLSYIISLLHKQLKFLWELDLLNEYEDVDLEFFKEELDNIESNVLLVNEEINKIKRKLEAVEDSKVYTLNIYSNVFILQTYSSIVS